MMKKMRGTSVNQLSVLYNESTMIHFYSIQIIQSTQGAIKKYKPTTKNSIHISQNYFLKIIISLIGR